LSGAATGSFGLDQVDDVLATRTMEIRVNFEGLDPTPWSSAGWRLLRAHNGPLVVCFFGWCPSMTM